MERSEIRFGTTRIGYEIRRSGRRSTVAIAIDPGAGVVLTAPAKTPVERLDRVVYQKARWILDRLRRASDRPPPLPARELTHGETFHYLGRQYRLRLVPGEPGESMPALRGGWLVVPCGGAPEGEAREAVVRAALERWYRAHAEARLPGRARLFARAAGVPEPRVLLRAQAKRWASCDAGGTLRFNWRVMQAPLALVDYVVAHEVCHLLHRDHTQAFWSALGRVMPDYERRRERLRQVGRLYVW